MRKPTARAHAQISHNNKEGKCARVSLKGWARIKKKKQKGMLRKGRGRVKAGPKRTQVGEETSGETGKNHAKKRRDGRCYSGVDVEREAEII